MLNNDKLLEDYREPVHQRIVINDLGHYQIKHAIPVGKRNVLFINISETYNPYNEWEQHKAMVRAKREWRKARNYIKS